MTTATREASGTTRDATLVAAARAGDDAAFAELFRRYSPRITAFVRRMLGDQARAEDVAQDAFVSALRRMRATDADINFRPWIFEIAKNACIDSIRRSGRAEEISMDAETGLRASDHLRLVGPGPAPEGALIAKERLRHLQGAIDELPEIQARILVMRELEGLSYREIGERLDLTGPAVESALFRARRRLVREYADIETGARCEAMTAAAARLAEGLESARDRRRLARHIHRCHSCRRQVREFGLAIEPSRPLAGRVAAMLPVPAFLSRRRGGVAGADGASGGFVAGAQQGVASWLPIVGAGAPSGAGWSRVAAVLASAAIAGGSAVVSQELPSPQGPSPGGTVAAPSGGGGAAAHTLRTPSLGGGTTGAMPAPRAREHSSPTAQAGPAPAARGDQGAQQGTRGGGSPLDDAPVSAPEVPVRGIHDVPSAQVPEAPSRPQVSAPEVQRPEAPAAPEAKLPDKPAGPQAPAAEAPPAPSAPSTPSVPTVQKPDLPESPSGALPLP